MVCIEYLVEVLLEEQGDHEDLTAPLLVIASVSKNDFKSKYLNSYTYEVITVGMVLYQSVSMHACYFKSVVIPVP